MPVKQAIIAELGESELLAPDAIARSLIANDQAKYYFALLQAARAKADHPHARALDLRSEREASSLSDPWLDDVIEGTRKHGGDGFLVPHGREIVARITSAIEAMLACLSEKERSALGRRLADAAPRLSRDDIISGSMIDAMTSGSRSAGDSLHLIVMDAHRAINAKQASISVETVAGARVHGLSDSGRRRVEAFMSGLNRTAPLKFDHPGLGTTATEHEGRILIQNDIGTTDAHVLVIRVDGATARVTYTDVHRQRLAFFVSLFDDWPVVWEGPAERRSEQLTESDYFLTTGTFTASDEASLDAYLAHLGSRLVYLIDWNRMRKRLRGFVAKRRAIEILTWAAKNDYGHRALLEIGGEAALGEAVEYAAGQQLRYGQRLDDMIGEKRAAEFIKEAMQLASVGLRQRRSRRSILDEIKARLRCAMDSERVAIFDIAARHVAFGCDLATGLCEAVERLGQPAGEAWSERFAARAGRWEVAADVLLNEARADIKRFIRPLSLTRFFEYADDSVDEMEEAAALVEIAAKMPPPAPARSLIAGLAETALEASLELIKCVECAALITRQDVRDDLDEFLQAIERIIAAEHAADDLLRRIRRHMLLEPAVDQRQILLLQQLADALERATDAQAHAAQMMRSYLLEEVIL